MRTPEELTDRFRAEGLKVTPQRQAVFQVLWDNDAHPTAEAVHAEVVAELPTVSLRTVYQTLNDLAAMGEIGHLTFGTGSARFDPNNRPHHHLVCETCGAVADVAADDDVILAGADAAGFQVTRTEITFRGRCASCAAADHHPQPSTNNQKEHQHG